jgi:alkane 1-monooxygenase
MSDQVNPKGFWFQYQKPQTNSDYFGFVVLISFLGAVNVVIGHELMHHREFHNKIFGTLPATKFMYSQLIDEHLKGHHKTVATMVDPATSRKNETLYAFCLRSMYGSLTNVWGYESDKITKRYGADASAFTRFFYNKMVWYQVLHASILYSIYFFLGWESLKF